MTGGFISKRIEITGRGNHIHRTDFLLSEGGSTMLTYEKVLNVFGDYLQQDPLYEIVSTSHGYTLLAWEPGREEWYNAQILKTPKAMLNALLETYASYLEDKITQNERDLTPQEQEQIDSQCKQLREKCLES